VSDAPIPAQPADVPGLTLIQQIKDGSLHPGTLNKEQRQQCVETFTFEGYSVSQIAQIVKRSEKTIRRDLDDIRMSHALSPSAELGKGLIGQFFMRWEMSHSALIRLARSKEGSVSERTQAERHAWDVTKEGIQLLQSLGYLPQRPVQGEFIHHLDSGDEDQPIEAAEQVISEIQAIAEETGGLSPEVARELPILRQKLEQAKLQQKARDLLSRQKESDSGREDSNVG